MSKEKNIQIPYSLFISTMRLLESLDPQIFDDDISDLYQSIIYGFNKKKSSILLHNNYSRIFEYENNDALKIILDAYISKKQKHQENFRK